MILKAAIDSSSNIINGICNVIVKTERDTQLKGDYKVEHLAYLQQLLNQESRYWKLYWSITIPTGENAS